MTLYCKQSYRGQK